MSEIAPIVAQMDPSDEQRPAILARGSDVAVTAGAGTGKTRTLVARYLSLLADGLPPRSVVAITFTRKAAREMRNRVREQVRRYLETPDLDAAAWQRWQDVYTALDAARIGTIHSLCGEILRTHPAEAQIDPRFEVLDEGQAALLRVQAIDEALAWAADDAQGAALFALLGERDLRATLTDLLAQRLDAAEALAAQPDDSVAIQERWAEIVDAWRVKAQAALLADPAFQEAAHVLHESVPGDPTDRAAVQRQAALDALTRGGKALAALDQIDLRGGRAGAWRGGREELGEVKAALRALRDLWRANRELLTLELNASDDALARAYPALRALYARAAQRYAAFKAERQALDFDDLEDAALSLLRDHPAVRAHWRSQVRALLVDEFQDTNGRQRDLLDLLNGGERKLFVVGDGKQSIYRFRGADVTVFRQVHAEIKARGRTCDLATSYRAHRALIGGLNALLEPALGSCQDPRRPYVEPFAPLCPHRQDAAQGLLPPFIELHLAAGTKADGALDRAARAIVARLVSLVDGSRILVEEPDPDTGAIVSRPLGYGHVAILCRASTSFAAYENALEAAGVPYLTVAGRGFYERPEVRDVLNALQALADPSDDLALAGLLRSPACGLSDMALYRLAQARGDEGCPSLWAALCLSDLGFLRDEASRAAMARDRIGRLHASVGRVAVADVLKAYLDETDYRAILLRAGQARAVGNVSKLLADAQASGIVDVSAFLEWVGQLRDVGTREGEAPTVASSAVQIMSVHAAKGLEFPVVVIGDAGRNAPRTGGTLIDTTLGVVLPLQESTDGQKAPVPAVYQLARRSAADQEAAESDRLLYVAATRAQEMLLVSGTIRSKPSGWLDRLGAALDLADALPNCDPEGEAVHRLSLLAGDQPVLCCVYEERAEIAAHAASAPSTAAPSLPDECPLLQPIAPAPHVEDEEAREATRDPPRRVWRVVPTRPRPRAPSWVVGQIVHGALERWTFPDGPGGLYRWAQARAQSLGITDEREMRDAVQRAARILRRFQGTPLYARMADAAERFHEVPYSIVDADGRVENGVIDALFREGREWVLVEFKTDRIRDADALEDKLAQEDYVPQVRRYLDAAERLLGRRPQPVLCLLDYRGSVHLVEERW